MIKYLFLVITTFLLLSCGRNNSRQQTENDSTVVDTVAIMNDPTANLNIQTTSFSEVDSSGIVMFPLSMGESKEQRSSVYKDMPTSNYWNIIFYNSNTGEYHLLSDRKMLIGSFETKYTRYDDVDLSISSKHIFYRVTTDDLNRDKKLTAEDPEYLFVTDKQGKNFRQISPAGFNVRSWQYIKASNKTIMLVTKDSNNDKKFDDEDEIASFQIDIDKDSVAREIFPDDFKKNLKILFDRDWKRIRR